MRARSLWENNLAWRRNLHLLRERSLEKASREVSQPTLRDGMVWNHMLQGLRYNLQWAGF